MAVMPTVTLPGARTRLNIPGVTDVGPMMAPMGVPAASGEEMFWALPVGQPVVAPGGAGAAGRAGSNKPVTKPLADKPEPKPLAETPPPPVATAPPPVATTTAAPPPFQLDPNWWWQQFTGSSQYQMQAPNIRAEEDRIASQAGYRINRDATQGSSTYGQILYRVRNGAEGSGAIVARLETVPGSVPPQARYVYRDAAGNEYQPADLEIDVVRLKPGDVGYAEGQFGQAEMASAARMPDIGVQASRAGAGRSGVRAAAATMETQALQRALANIASQAGREFGATGQRWMDLINSLYPGLAESAKDLWEASQTPPPAGGGETGGETGGGTPGLPPGVPANQGPTIGVGGMTYGVGDQVAAGPFGVGMFSVKGEPGGKPPKNPKVRELYRGPGGVWWAWRPDGPKGKGWYKYVPEAPGAPSPTQAGVTTRPPASSTPPPPPAAAPPPPSGPQFSFGGATYSQGDRVPAGPSGVGQFSRKGSAPAGAPSNPPARTLWRGAGGVWFAYRPEGPNGAGWYRQP